MTGRKSSFRTADICASVVLMLMSAFWLASSLNISGIGGIFPRDVAVFALVVSAVNLFTTWRRNPDTGSAATQADDLTPRELAAMLWPALLVLLIWLLGFLMAIPVFMAAFMISRRNVSLVAGGGAVLSLTLAIYLLFVVLLGARLHTGIWP